MTRPMPCVDAVLFDLDGTLCDTLPDIAAAMNRVLAAQELAGHPVASFRRFVGSGVRALCERVLPPGEQHRLEAVLAAFSRDYGAHLVEATRPYDGVEPLLAGLAERHLALGVLSNKPHALTTALVEALFGKARFFAGAVRGQRPDEPRKPDPAGAWEVARALAAPPERCLFVGDSEIDMATAHAAGMPAVGVAWGYGERTAIEAAGALAILEHPAELLAWLDSRGD